MRFSDLYPRTEKVDVIWKTHKKLLPIHTYDKEVYHMSRVMNRKIYSLEQSENSWKQFSIKHLNIKMLLSGTIQIESRNLFSRSFFAMDVKNYLEWLKDKIHFMMKIFVNSRLLFSLRLSFRIWGHNSYWEYTYQNIFFQNISTYFKMELCRHYSKNISQGWCNLNKQLYVKWKKSDVLIFFWSVEHNPIF